MISFLIYDSGPHYVGSGVGHCYDLGINDDIKTAHGRWSNALCLFQWKTATRGVCSQTGADTKAASSSSVSIDQRHRQIKVQISISDENKLCLMSIHAGLKYHINKSHCKFIPQRDWAKNINPGSDVVSSHLPLAEGGGGEYFSSPPI